MQIFDQKILDRIGKKLLKKKSTIAVAESVTSGLLQFALAGIDNAIRFYQGGVTTYNLAQKYKHLQVEPIHAQEVNCVSPQVALQMALQVTEEFNSDWGIGITGYATPVPESGHKLFSYYAITHKGKPKLKGKLTASKDLDPADVQLSYVNTVLNKLEKSL